MSAREDVLRRVRRALTDAESGSAPVPSPSGVHLEGDALTQRFVERVEDYRAIVHRCPADDVGAAVRRALPAGASVVLPPDLPSSWHLDLPHAVVDQRHSAADLDRFDAVVTAARLGIAETGTLVLDHTGDQGRRAISLVPDLHICVVRADQLVADVPQAMDRLDPGRPLTWISGPSATSDIELDRVEGVHGPRTLHVILVD